MFVYDGLQIDSPVLKQTCPNVPPGGTCEGNITPRGPGGWHSVVYQRPATLETWSLAVPVATEFSDTDGDGCADIREVATAAPSEATGGQRDPNNPWDYYDVNGDRVIDLANDILGVVNHFAPGGYPPGDEIYDRGPAKGGASWKDTHPPDGVIDLANDILGVIAQFQHNCI